MRLFFASWPPAEAAEALARWAEEAQRGCGGRVTPPERIHLTLAFLGDVDARIARALAGGLRLPRTRFTLVLARYWPRNRIVWAGPLETPPALAALARSLGETREFEAHVTLIRKARPPRRLLPLPAVEWPVAQFSLVNSVPGPEGPGYEVLERYALQ